MNFVNRGKKLGFYFLTFIILFLIASITIGTISSSANSNKTEKQQPEDSFATLPFGFSSDNQPVANTRKDQSENLVNSPVFTEFDSWVNSYVNNGFRAGGEQIDVGENLAVKRQQILKELIQNNPQAALEKAISAETFDRLPAYITEHSEKRISAYGDFMVYVVEEINRTTGESTGSRTDRQVVIGDSKYQAFVYGRREAMTSKLNIPIQGIVIGDTMAVDENSAREINSAEYARRGIDQLKVGENGAAAEVGGKVVYFTNQSELENFVREQIEWESKIGPTQPDQPLAPEEQASSWTEGAKTVLVIRVDFSDKPGEPLDHYDQPLTSARAQSLIDNDVNSFYVNNSYNKTSMQSTVTPVVRLPQTQAFYSQGSNYNTMLTDARVAARAAGFETNNYNLDLVTFSYTPNIGWAGIAAIGAKSAMLNGAFYLPETAHELGHNYGLLHANLWRTTDGSIIGPGSNVEYNDCYDNMGACVNGSASRHFNARYKRLLDWLTDANVQTVTSSGIYRIFAQDSPSPGGIRTLKINKDATKNYWVEFRQQLTYFPNSLNGALIRWDYSSQNFRETQVLDMNPATASGVRDEPLLVGQSFYDSAGNIKITIVGKGGTTPESLDVNVELNSSGGTPTPTPTPSSCTYSITPASQSFSTAGGTGSVNVTTTGGCGWTAASSQSFVAVTSGSNGTGSGTVNYSVAANTGASRSATMTIAGQTFTVQQVGAATSGYTLVATPTVVAPGGQFTVNFTAPSGSSTVDWVGLFRVGAANNDYLDGGYTTGLTVGSFIVPAPSQIGQYEFRYLLNNGFVSVITSNTVTVQIAPTPTPTPTCAYSITPASQNFSAAGGTGSVNVTTTGGCNWTAASDQNFVAITFGSSGTSSGTISFSVVANATASARAATLTVAGKIFSVTQQANIVNNNAHTAFDFDGDYKSDISVFRPSNGIWYMQESTAGFVGLQFGAANDKLVPADYDGDGKTDVAVYRDGNWFIQESLQGFTNAQFGSADDTPVPADFDGDGKTDAAVYRSSTGTWFLQRSLLGFTAVQFGSSGDKPVAADFDGDGKADLAVYRPSTGIWYIQQSTAGFTGVQFGDANDKLVAADYDGDGKTDVAVYRPSNGFWYLNRSQAGFIGIQFGSSTDIPVPADYDGDRKADIAVFRSGTWYLQGSSAGFSGVQFGSSGDKPAPNAFVP